MKKQTREDLEKIYREEDALKGCISRMCVTDEPKELSEMFIHARDRITNIYNVNWDRLAVGEETETRDCRDVLDGEKIVKLTVTMPERILAAIKNGEYCGILDKELYQSLKEGVVLSDDENKDFILKIDGNYYAGRNKKYSDMYDISGRGPLGAERMNRKNAEKLRDHYNNCGRNAEIEEYNPQRYLKESLGKIIKCDDKNRAGEDTGYTIRNLAQKCIEYTDQIFTNGEMGYWIIERDPNTGKDMSYHCSKCYGDSGFTTTSASKFCPNCGKKMHRQPIEENIKC